MTRFDVAVIGAGPAGHAAAVTAATAGKRTVLLEQEPHPGGECVHRGTIPSKTLREAAQAISSFARKTGGVIPLTVDRDLTLESLLERKSEVVESYQAQMANELEAAGVTRWHGRARFTSPTQLEVTSVGGAARALEASLIVLATGSRPRAPAEVPIDHEHVFDSDSILSMGWLPRSLTVLGGGVIACEYATIFAALGARVTLIDRGPRPLGFLDQELTDVFLRAFEQVGGRFLGQRRVARVETSALDGVSVTLDDGQRVVADKALCALGRVANVHGLELAKAGLSTDARGLIAVDDRLRTTAPHVVAVGDVIGPPSLASTSMEQGRRAVRLWLGQPSGPGPELIPAGVYTIPEMSAVGLTEAQARERGPVLIGRARFDRIARCRINATGEGLLKLVCDGDGQRVLGVHVVGEGAAELVHLGQLALSARLPVDVFVDDVFNFPTLAEAYRVAALEVVHQRSHRTAATAA